MGLKLLFAATVAAFVAFVVPADAGPLTARGDRRDWAYALALQRDGKLIAAGVTRVRGRDGLALARYTPSGGLDPSFGAGGKVVAPRIGPGGGVAIQLDGKVLAGTTGALVRYGAGGRLDRSFGHGGKVAAGYISDIAIAKDGRIITAGDEVVRYTRRGDRDRSFGHDGRLNNLFFTTAIQPDGKIVALSTRGLVARYTSRGTVDRTFRQIVVNMDGSHALALAHDGKIVIAGQQRNNDASDFAVARLTSNGALDRTFGHGGEAVVDFTPCSACIGTTDVPLAVAVQRDGKIVAAGASDLNGPCADAPAACDSFALVRFNEDGSLDPSFGRGGKVETSFVSRVHRRSSSVAQGVVIQRDGKIVAAGVGNAFDFGLARYTTSGRLDPTFGRGGKVLTDFGSG